MGCLGNNPNVGANPSQHGRNGATYQSQGQRLPRGRRKPAARRSSPECIVVGESVTFSRAPGGRFRVLSTLVQPTRGRQKPSAGQSFVPAAP